MSKPKTIVLEFKNNVYLLTASVHGDMYTFFKGTIFIPNPNAGMPWPPSGAYIEKEIDIDELPDKVLHDFEAALFRGNP